MVESDEGWPALLSEHDRAVLEKFVTPFYLGYWGPLVGEPAPGREMVSEADRVAWLAAFAEAASELDEPTARSLLAVRNWRHHLTIPWMVGFRDWKHFAEQLEQIQESSTRKAQPGLSVGLVMLGQPTSAPVLCRYLDVALQSTYSGERPAWAMAAVVELDKLHGTEWAAPYLADGGLWQEYADRPNRGLAPVAEIVSSLTSYRPDAADGSTDKSADGS